MIDDSVVQMFKAALTHLVNSKEKATGFQVSMTIGKAKGKVHAFLVQDDRVADRIYQYLDALAKDHGGRKPFDVEVDPGARPDSN